MWSCSLTPAVDDGVRVWRDDHALGAGLLVAFSDRNGGASAPPFDSLNLGARGGDAPEHVEENRRRVGRAAGFDERALVLTRQVHGTSILEVRSRDSGIAGDADGLFARQGSGSPVLGVLSADCAAVAIAGEGGVALVHAGWRGLAGGVVAKGVEAVGRVLAAWVGPAIGACCYEVGPEVIEAFISARLPVADATHVDISGAAVAALRNEAVGNVAWVDECTCCSPSYFSYRRDGVTGRQGAFLARL